MPGGEPDPFDVRRVRRAPALLRSFNAAGLLAPADVHVALRLAALAGEGDETVALAAAFAVRGPRLGHVLVDLAQIAETATVEGEEPEDLCALPWPEPGRWTERVAASALVGVGEDEEGPARPLRLVGTWLYLDRYWREERELAADLRAMSDRPPPEVRVGVLADGLGRIFAGQTQSRQCLAAACAVTRRLCVVAGGPGTGKTTTVAGIAALLAEQAVAAGARAPLVALAAPTGKAAARLEEAVHQAARDLPVDEAIRAGLLGLRASTLHRLLGGAPPSQSRFHHHRGQRLPDDVVIVDETSMVSLWLMARLVEAIRPEARLILMGDPGQLASIEAGAVMGDIIGPARGQHLLIGPPARVLLGQATGHAVVANDPPPGTTMGDGIVILDRVHRFGAGIARLAAAIGSGDAAATLEVLAHASDGLMWIPLDAADPAVEEALAPVRDRAREAAGTVIQAARTGAARQAIQALGAFRVLCAHRRGPQGVAAWNERIETWLAGAIEDYDPAQWSVGRPLLVTANDYELQLYNGDTGVIVQTDVDRVSAVFERRGEVLELSPVRLEAIDTAYAMTIHRCQGSQFDTVAVLLPAPTSRLLTRELLYTAATRARRLLIVVGSEATIGAAVARPVGRTSGLGWRLWGEAVAGSRRPPQGSG